MKNLTVKRGSHKDIDNQELTLTVQIGGLTSVVEGHINNRTNFVHLYAENEEQEKELTDMGVNLEDICVAIENREIEIN